jgi:hypothetical protein
MRDKLLLKELVFADGSVHQDFWCAGTVAASDALPEQGSELGVERQRIGLGQGRHIAIYPIFLFIGLPRRLIKFTPGRMA